MKLRSKSTRRHNDAARMRNRQLGLESLEGRRLLAVLAGDANEDFYFDESDLVQVSKAGKLETGEAATWQEGDWKDDGVFNTADLVASFATGNYASRQATDASAGRPTHLRNSLVEEAGANVTLTYDTTTGGLRVDSNAPLSAFHLVSKTDSFNLQTPSEFDGIYDVSSNASKFKYDPSGFQSMVIGSTHAPGFPVDLLLADLDADGALLGGGDIGDVGLQLCDSCVDGSSLSDAEIPVTPEPHDLVLSMDGPADVTVVYDFVTGGLQVETELDLVSLEIISSFDMFHGRPEALDGPFDLLFPNQVFFLRPNGTQEVDLGNVARPGLSSSQLTSELSLAGAVYVNGGPDTRQLATAQLVTCNSCVTTVNPAINTPVGPTETGFHFPHREFDFPNLPSVSDTVATLVYDSATGEMVYVSPFETAILEVVSQQSIFDDEAGPEFTGTFDVVQNAKLFYLEPTGFSQLYLGYATEPGLSVAELSNDLSIAGSMLPSGGLLAPEIISCENCLLGSNVSLPTEGVVGGDANQDFFFDEADWIQAFKTGRYETDVVAGWEQGDFSGDLVFDSVDMVVAFQNGNYGNGAYSDQATTAVHTRQHLEPAGEGDADYTVTYDPDTGTLEIEGSETTTALHLHSNAGIFTGDDAEFDGHNPFNVDSDHSLMMITPTGSGSVVLDGFAAPNLDYATLLTDLTIDGARSSGGGLGTVELVCETCDSGTVLPAVPGDFTQDSALDVSDILMLHDEIVAGSNRAYYDVTGDGLVNRDDMATLVADLMGAKPGDANLDGVFDSSDLVQVFVNGHYEDDVDGGSLWQDGDWNMDGDFDSSDLVLAHQSGGYQLAATSDFAAAIDASFKTHSDSQRRGDAQPRASFEVQPSHQKRIVDNTRLVRQSDTRQETSYDAHELDDLFAQVDDPMWLI